MTRRLLLGLTGNPGSGKSAGAAHLIRVHRFTELNSSFLSQLALEQGIELRKRSDYAAFQRKLRIERSKSFITDAILDMPENRVVHTGLRNKFDAQRLQEAGGWIVAFACPLAIRFERTRGTDDKYPDTLMDFVNSEAPEYDDPDPYGNHTHWVMQRANYVIDSSKPLAQVHLDLDAIIEEHS